MHIVPIHHPPHPRRRQMLCSLARRTVCASCRLRQTIAAKQLLRLRKPALAELASRRAFRSPPSRPSKDEGRRAISGDEQRDGLVEAWATDPEPDLVPRAETGPGTGIGNGDEAMAKMATEEDARSQTLDRADMDGVDALSPQALDEKALEEVVVKARLMFGDRLPDGLLSVEQGKVYERLYGRPLKMIDEAEEDVEEDVDEEVDVDEEADLDADGDFGQQEGVRAGSGMMKEKGSGQWDEVEVETERVGTNGGRRFKLNGDTMLAHDIEDAMASEDLDAGEDEEPDLGGESLRTHPLTVHNRFATSPTTLQLPQDTFVTPISVLVSSIPRVHLTQAAHRLFGGIGLPDSTATPQLGKTRQQKPIPLDASQGRMNDIDADVFSAVLMPAMYASVMGVLVETRKRLGTAWAESMVRKAEAGQLRILDAGGAGVGVLAVRELLKAEWERMHEEDGRDAESTIALAEADGRVGGAGLPPPQGNATVVTGSDTLRHRASHLLDNTTFIPRIPDYVHTVTAKQSGKFDIVIAPHTIWPIREDWLRKTHVENLWSMLNADGGVLCMLEKGVARGFEAIAGARDLLINTRIASAGKGDERHPPIQTGRSGIEWDGPAVREKELGMIIAPCTNHTACPMYTGDKMGTIKGRKDICHFAQRYVRPPSLQKILGARDKNFEDVKFAYLAVMRGQDLRSAVSANAELASQPAVMQGDAATDRAFAGYGHATSDPASTPQPLSPEAVPSSFSLPRAIVPPLKRHGHVIIDVCTPSGTFERWTVPRSFSKQAFRDARKSAWGDLWALGAKTRVPRTVKLGKHARREDKKVELSKKAKKEKRRIVERKAGKQGRLVTID